MGFMLPFHQFSWQVTSGYIVCLGGSRASIVSNYTMRVRDRSAHARRATFGAISGYLTGS